MTGLAALIWGVNPTLTRDEVVSIILNNTDTIGTPHVDVGTEKINYYKAAQAALAMRTYDLGNITDSSLSLDTNESVPPLNSAMNSVHIIVESSRNLYFRTQYAYDSIVKQNDTIKAKALELEYENLIFDRNIKVRLQGGYDNLFENMVSKFFICCIPSIHHDSI